MRTGAKDVTELDTATTPQKHAAYTPRLAVLSNLQAPSTAVFHVAQDKEGSRKAWWAEDGTFSAVAVAVSAPAAPSSTHAHSSRHNCFSTLLYNICCCL